MLDKLTNSGIKCNNYLYFTFFGEHFDTKAITKELGILPTSIGFKKDKTPKSTSWDYRLNATDDLDLATYLERLIDLFEPKIDVIIRLKKEFKLNTRLQFVIDIDVSPESSTPYFGLNDRTIKFLNSTGTDVDFDLYKVDPQRLLK
ncbi:MAG: DUF4279 domain-containing protein [Crocinitomix sp.]|nr:DUF4279 domain-containing protein [Crocinitomix sp.]